MSYQPIKDIENKQIDGNDCECRSEMKPLPLLRTPVRDWAFFFFSIALFSFLGFLFGTWTVNFQHPILSSDGRLAPAGDIETRWTYNHTFSREPDLESEAAWGSLPPSELFNICRPRFSYTDFELSSRRSVHPKR